MSLKDLLKELARLPIVKWIIAAVLSLPFFAQQTRDYVHNNGERHAIIDNMEGGVSPAYGSITANNLETLTLVKPITDLQKRARRFIIVGDVHGCKAERKFIHADAVYNH